MKELIELINRILEPFLLYDDDDDEWIQNALYEPEARVVNSERETFDELSEHEYPNYQIFVIPIKVEVDNDVHSKVWDLCVYKDSLLKSIKRNTKCAEKDIFIPGLVATFNNLATPKYMRDLLIMADCYFIENEKIRVMAYEEQEAESVSKDGYLFIPFVCKKGSVRNTVDQSSSLLVLEGAAWNGIQLLSKSGKNTEGVRFKVMDLFFSILKYSGETASVISHALEERISKQTLRNRGDKAGTDGIAAPGKAAFPEDCVNAIGDAAQEAARLKKALKESEKERERLEKELARKEKALAEMATLLVLRKKADGIREDPEDE